jgi:hypothetical protein
VDDLKGNDRKEKSSRLVRFAQNETDQALLQAIEQTMATESLSFSDLCKQALHQFFASEQAPQTPELEGYPALITTLQQQILELQTQVARLEGKEEARQRYALRRVEQQVRELGERLSTLERKEYLENQVRQLTDRLARLEIPSESAVSTLMTDRLPADPEPSESVDPLLSRLAPLLEDF